MGKGLNYWQILKLLFYMGASVVSMVLPLTILLAAIMTFGDFGERYELAAMKAAGISLTRVMMPLFVTVCFLSGLLFVFSNNVIPDFQKKAKNMLYNIAATKPALNFTAGQFIDQIPGYVVKFDKILGEDGDRLEGIFIHKKAGSFEGQQNIVAKKGRFVPTVDKSFLKLELYDGYVFEENYTSLDYKARYRQPDQAIKFDTLVSHFDVSDLINQALEQEKITDDYRFETYGKLNKTIANKRKEHNLQYEGIANDLVSRINSDISLLQIEKKAPKTAPKEQLNLAKSNKDEKMMIYQNAYNKLEDIKNTVHSRDIEIAPNVSQFSKMVLYQQRIVAYSVTCIIFYLIGASLGSIIRKGGMGLPVVIAIIIFIIFYVLNLSIENIAWSGKLNPYLAAWLPNFILFPFGVWLTYKALTDSQLFDAEKYKAFFKPLIKRFSKEKEHARYQ